MVRGEEESDLPQWSFQAVRRTYRGDGYAGGEDPGRDLSGVHWLELPHSQVEAADGTQETRLFNPCRRRNTKALAFVESILNLRRRLDINVQNKVTSRV
jgi:hypothetical protein